MAWLGSQGPSPRPGSRVSRAERGAVGTVTTGCGPTWAPSLRYRSGGVQVTPVKSVSTTRRQRSARPAPV